MLFRSYQGRVVNQSLSPARREVGLWFIYLKIAVTGLSADADVQLLNSSGGVISSSTAGGTTFHNY